MTTTTAASDDGQLKADLHVHSYHSGMNGDLPFFRCRDCYTDPGRIYDRAKALGMDLVTITDHDCIDGGLELLARRGDLADFILGEEYECLVPDTDLKVHIGVLGLDETMHGELKRLRRDVFAAVAYLKTQPVAFTLNHLFHFYHQQVDLDAYVHALVAEFPLIETKNGTMSRGHNALVATIAEAHARAGRRLGRVGGSDGHILRRVGRNYTTVPGRNRSEFLANLRQGQATAHGPDATWATVATEIHGVIFRFWASLLGLERGHLRGLERLTSGLLAACSVPFVSVVPATVALGSKLSERRRVDRVAMALNGEPRPAWLGAENSEQG